MKAIKIIMYALLLTIIANFVSAFGITSFYWEPDRSLSLLPGETRNVELQLQNMVGSEDITVSAEVTEGKEIAVILDTSNIYKVSAGHKDVYINLKITMPENYLPGQKTTVTVSVKDVGEGEGGMMDFGTAVLTSFPVVQGQSSVPVEIQKSTVKEKSMVLYFVLPIALISIVAIAVIMLFVKRRKKPFSTNKKK